MNSNSLKMEGRKISPRFSSSKEYESPIHLYRVSAGLTVSALSQESKVNANSICALANGSMAPIKEINGEIRASARKLCKFFNVEPEELFPRYFCAINRSYKFEISCCETWSERNAEFYGDSIVDKMLAQQLVKEGLMSESSRNRKIFYLRLCGSTLKEIGAEVGFTGARVRQIFERCMRKIRQTAREKGFKVIPDYGHRYF